jgi:hypothetical protein
MTKPLPPDEPVLESHAATSPEHCGRMEKRFKGQGLDLKLVATPQKGKGLLSFLCLFKGKDADPEADRWTTYNKDESDD